MRAVYPCRHLIYPAFQCTSQNRPGRVHHLWSCNSTGLIYANNRAHNKRPASSPGTTGRSGASVGIKGPIRSKLAQPCKMQCVGCTLTSAESLGRCLIPAISATYGKFRSRAPRAGWSKRRRKSCRPRTTETGCATNCTT